MKIFATKSTLIVASFFSALSGMSFEFANAESLRRATSSCDHGVWHAIARAGNAYGEGWHSDSKSKAEDIAIGQCEAYATSSDVDKCEENVQVECQEDRQRRTSSCDGDWYAYTHAGNAYGEGWHSNSESKAAESAIETCKKHATSNVYSKCEDNVRTECEERGQRRASSYNLWCAKTSAGNAYYEGSSVYSESDAVKMAIRNCKKSATSENKESCKRNVQSWEC